MSDIKRLLEDERREHLNAIKVIDSLLAKVAGNGYNGVSRELAPTKESSVLATNGGSRKSIKEMILALFKKESRFLHMREIGTLLFDEDRDGNFKDFIDKKVGPVMYSFKNKGTLMNIKVDSQNRNTFWGSKKWMGSDGLPKKEHIYNEAYLVKRNVDEI